MTDSGTLLAAPDVQGFMFDGGFLLMSPQRLLAHDGAVEQIWRSIEAGPSPRDPGVAQVAELWLRHGLLVSGSGTARRPRPEPRPLPEVPSNGWAREWVCAIGGRRFFFAVEHPRGAALIHILLHAHEVDPGGADWRFEVHDTAPDEAALRIDGQEVLRTRDPGLILGAIYQNILERLHGAPDWMALIHGGAVALGGAGIGLPAPSGSGKTTLTAALIAEDFTYLADDLLAVAAPAGDVLPWPMPLSIKSGSWDVVSARHPRLRDQPIFSTKGLEARLLLPDDGAWEQPPVRLRALVFPKFQAGAAVSLTPLRPLAVLSRLLNDRYWLGCPLEPAQVQRFLAWLKGLPAWELRYGSLDDATKAMRSLHL